MRIFNSQFKRCLSKRYILSILTIYIITILITSLSVYNYLILKDATKDHRTTEDLYRERMTSYTSFSVIGMRVLFCPTPLAVFSTPVGYDSSLKGRFDSISELELYSTSKDIDIAIGKIGSLGSLTYFFFLLGSITVAIYGYFSFFPTGYFKHLMSQSSPSIVFTSGILARLLFLTANLVIIWIFIISIVKIGGIAVNRSDYLGFLALALQTWIFLSLIFLAAVFISLINSRIKSILYLLISWIAFVIILPCLPLSLISGNPLASKNNTAVIKRIQLKKIIDFERMVVKNHGLAKNLPIAKKREFAEHYWNNVYNEIESLESSLRIEKQRRAENLGKLTVIIPSLHYLYIYQELNDSGYTNYFNFYSHLQKLKREYLRHYFDGSYYGDPKVVKPFKTTADSIYYGQAKWPAVFWPGNLVTLLYSLGLFFIGYRQFNRLYFPRLKNQALLAKLKLTYSRGKAYNLNFFDESIRGQLFNILFARWPELSRHLVIDGETVDPTRPPSVLYIPCPSEFPAYKKVRGLVYDFKVLCGLGAEDVGEIERGLGAGMLNRRFGALAVTEKYTLILRLVEKTGHEIIIFDNFSRILPTWQASMIIEAMTPIRASRKILLDFSELGPAWLDGVITAYKIDESGAMVEFRFS